MKKLLIFDLDGTVLDTLDDLADALNYALRAYGHPVRGRAEVRRMVGNGIANLVSRGVLEGREGVSEEAVEAVLTAFRGYYADHCLDQTRPYAGVPAALEKFKAGGYRLALVSNKADSAVQTLCRQFFPGVFDYVAGEKPGVRRKPAADMVRNALSALGMTVRESVYIGDSEVDVATAQNAGADMIAVTWGFRDREALTAAGATRFADTPEELEKLLLPSQ